MTSYGSYNPVNKPIILDSVIISVSNCSFSFIAGFAVWTVVGYLAKLGQLDESNTAGISLAFFTYPTAIDTIRLQTSGLSFLGAPFSCLVSILHSLQLKRPLLSSVILLGKEKLQECSLLLFFVWLASLDLYLSAATGDSSSLMSLITTFVLTSYF